MSITNLTKLQNNYETYVIVLSIIFIMFSMKNQICIQNLPDNVNEQFIKNTLLYDNNGINEVIIQKNRKTMMNLAYVRFDSKDEA